MGIPAFRLAPPKPPSGLENSSFSSPSPTTIAGTMQMRRHTPIERTRENAGEYQAFVKDGWMDVSPVNGVP